MCRFHDISTLHHTNFFRYPHLLGLCELSLSPQLHPSTTMAKSLRSKSKLRAKSIKRVKEFQQAVDERQLRIVERAKENLLKQQVAKGEEPVDKEAEMDVEVEGETKKTVSTSGDRNARHHNWKMANKKKNKSTAFAKSKKK